jgi:tetratricopeptide (TPR) repeat protein
VTNLLKAGDDDAAAKLMFDFIGGSWRRGRDTAATLRDLELLQGRLSPANAAAAAMWRAEALRYIGRLDEAREQGETACRAFEEQGDLARQAQALRLLGHIASDLGAPAQGRGMVARALALFEQVGDDGGRSQAEVVLGEIDYLLGDHARARSMLKAATQRCAALGDALGRAQCLILLALIDEATGAYERGRDLLSLARREFDAIGYRLGIAQCDVALGHADHRALEVARARSRALAARAALRELQNPRGEAACERLLAMVALDTDDYDAAAAHANVALKIYERLQDPWGSLESRLLLAQVALANGEDGAAAIVAECDRVVLDEAEPRQHRHLTRAWLAQKEQRWTDAATEIDRARAVFADAASGARGAGGGERARTGDHTPHLLSRFSRMAWVGPALSKIDTWLQQIEAGNVDPPMSSDAPTLN